MIGRFISWIYCMRMGHVWLYWGYCRECTRCKRREWRKDDRNQWDRY